MIRIANLWKRFGDHEVLRGVNLEIQDGETLTIIGGSGCGKSVLLKHMVGLLQPDDGTIEVDGVGIVGLPEGPLAEVQKHFGMLFQGAALFDSLSVGENVAFGLRHLKHLSDETVRAKVAERLGMVGLEGIEDLKPSELSGGMKKRVGLARAIATDPKYILYDEPTTGLDPIMADVITGLIVRLQKQLAITAIVVTHDMASAYKCSNRLAMLHEGRIVEAGTPDEIRNTTNPLVRQFITGSGEGPIQMQVRHPAAAAGPAR